VNVLHTRNSTYRAFSALNKQLLQGWNEMFLLKQEFGNCPDWSTIHNEIFILQLSEDCYHVYGKHGQFSYDFLRGTYS